MVYLKKEKKKLFKLIISSEDFLDERENFFAHLNDIIEIFPEGYNLLIIIDCPKTAPLGFLFGFLAFLNRLKQEKKFTVELHGNLDLINFFMDWNLSGILDSLKQKEDQIES